MYYLHKMPNEKKGRNVRALGFSAVFRFVLVGQLTGLGRVQTRKRVLGARAHVIVDIGVNCWPPGNVTILLS